jgi:hypothetical protein
LRFLNSLLRYGRRRGSARPRRWYIPAKKNRTLDVKNQKPLDREKIDAICAGIASLPVLDSGTPDEILGYDEFGVPR